MLNIAPDIRPVGLRYPSSLYNSSLERIIGALAIMRYTYALLTSLRTKCHAVERFDFSRNFPEYIWLWWMKYKSKHRAYCYQRSSFFLSVSRRLGAMSRRLMLRLCVASSTDQYIRPIQRCSFAVNVCRLQDSLHEWIVIDLCICSEGQQTASNISKPSR